MSLPRGIENKQQRIEIRAEGILRGAPWAELPDDTDINSDEAEEIEAARELAKQWQRA